ncbi:hypothetical protein A4X09_0g4243 [Tilletia walkeri]|uniref:Phytase-like domain-containing protein n=1 Tax=Tilletia walkeri TaxID=117179 RepID=A0A8X7N7V1_9BASI|nr:hypothetical protein A4X09_0g4243 [Tilletia walkeri]
MRHFTTIALIALSGAGYTQAFSRPRSNGNATAQLRRGSSALLLRQSDGGSGTGDGDPVGTDDTNTIIMNPDGSYVALNFDDPTAWDYDVPWPADTIAAITAINQQSVQNVKDDVFVNPDGSLVDPSSGTKDDSLSWVQIQDISGQYIMVASADDNFHVGPFGSTGDGILFGASANVVAQDSQDRPFFYYPDVMQKYGVSRFRLASLDQIPKTARMVTLVPINTGDAAGVYVAADALGNIFYPITCSYTDSRPSKVFLAKDADRNKVNGGPQTLISDAMQTIVTGGVVKDCGYMPWTSPNFAGLS